MYDTPRAPLMLRNMYANITMKITWCAEIFLLRWQLLVSERIIKEYCKINCFIALVYCMYINAYTCHTCYIFILKELYCSIKDKNNNTAGAICSLNKNTIRKWHFQYCYFSFTLWYNSFNHWKSYSTLSDCMLI